MYLHTFIVKYSDRFNYIITSVLEFLFYLSFIPLKSGVKYTSM